MMGERAFVRETGARIKRGSESGPQLECQVAYFTTEGAIKAMTTSVSYPTKPRVEPLTVFFFFW